MADKRSPAKRSAPAESSRPIRVLVLVDEANLVSSLRPMNRSLDWLQLRDFLEAAAPHRQVIETVVYSGLPPAMPAWQAEREKKAKFLHWLRFHGFLVTTREGSPMDDTHYKANVDVLLAIDAVELADKMQPEEIILVTGDSDFAELALFLRRRGIRVTAAAAMPNLGSSLRGVVNEVIDLGPLFESFEVIKSRDAAS